MIINFYLPENDSRLIDQLKNVSEQKRRSFSFIVREALEYYLLDVLKCRGKTSKTKEGRK
jgi:predicted DNA-binding protein